MKLLQILQLLFFFITCIFAQNELDWWETAAFYQIYPRSFSDSDGDGIGDLNGITSKLEYLKDIGIDAFWLSPIFKSPMFDFGYDISDFRDIDPVFGNLTDFDKLVSKAKSLGLKVILDYVPNHCSHEHEWFKKSVARDPEYDDYFMWHPGKPNPDGGQNLPPNNWISIFRGSAWTWNEERQEYYFHVFFKEQPELHYRSQKMRQEMPGIMKFWLDRGVDGFRIDATPHLMEVPMNSEGNYPDEPPTGNCDDPDNWNCYLDHIYTVNQDDSFALLYEWRDFLEKYTKENGGSTRIAMCEHYADVETVMRVYGEKNDTRKGPMMPFNFLILQEFKNGSTAGDLKATIDKWMTNKPKQYAPNWVMGNHDGTRVATRFGSNMINFMNVLILSLPGASVTYYGEEIGMVDGTIPPEDSKDDRDPVRTPMQWDNKKHAGFSCAAKTWLPVNENYLNGLNVKDESETIGSHLDIYKNMMMIKKSEAFKKGAFEYDVSGNVLLILRGTEKERYLILFNLNNEQVIVDASKVFKIPQTLSYAFTHADNRSKGATVQSNRITLEPKEALVMRGSANMIKGLKIMMFLSCILLIFKHYTNII
uniref:alpha-glucosidase n=1 Tax=Culicoides sonorensis TaxID=179676 RepID=A0A336LVB8_CULSO